MESKKRYVSIGYPLGYKIEPGQLKYMIETQKSVCELTNNEFLCWAEPLKYYNENPELINSLREKHVLIEYSDYNEWYEDISAFTMNRQGWGRLSDNKICVQLGKNIFYITKKQHAIWLSSNNYNSVDSFFKANYGEFNQCSNIKEILHEFHYNMNVLMEYELLFLK